MSQKEDGLSQGLGEEFRNNLDKKTYVSRLKKGFLIFTLWFLHDTFKKILLFLILLSVPYMLWTFIAWKFPQPQKETLPSKRTKPGKPAEAEAQAEDLSNHSGGDGGIPYEEGLLSSGLFIATAALVAAVVAYLVYSKSGGKGGDGEDGGGTATKAAAESSSDNLDLPSVPERRDYSESLFNKTLWSRRLLPKTKKKGEEGPSGEGIDSGPE